MFNKIKTIYIENTLTRLKGEVLLAKEFVADSKTFASGDWCGGN